MRRLCIVVGFLVTFPLLSVAQATDIDDLKAALQRAHKLGARGQVQVTVNFPPRPDPVRQVGKLPTLPFRPALLAKNFNVVASAGDLVAGHPTTRFDLTPVTGQAARWTLWMDQKQRIPLAFEERRAAGTLARQALFLKINARPVQINVKTPAIPAGLHAAVEQALPGLKLPPGFMPVSVKPVAQRTVVTLSDGANTLLLVIAARNVKAADGVASRRVENRFVWLVGDLPGNVLAEALAGVRQIDETALGTFLPVTDSNP